MPESNDRRVARRNFLGTTGLALAGMTVASGGSGEVIAAGNGGPPAAAATPEAALALLKEGNARFVAGKPFCGSLTARRLALASGQNPFAIVLGCSDSRVPVETIFDQMPGQIFVVRVAGNFVNDDGLGSIEYGVAVLHAKLLVVLGHQSCGAVGAAVDYVKVGTKQPGHIMDLVEAIEPSVKAVKGEPGDWVDNAIVRNVRDNVSALTKRSDIVAQAVKGGGAAVTGGVYDLHTGKVRFV